MNADELKALTEARDTLWKQHPIIRAKAILPTPAILQAFRLVRQAGERQRASVGFWAHPLAGKTSCLEALRPQLTVWFPGCGILELEAESKSMTAEGQFLETLWYSLNATVRVQRSLAGKREQLKRGLLALGASGQHVVILIDEAQELLERELCWLKLQINALSRHGYAVTVVMFGQHELIQRTTELQQQGRTDLHDRFFQDLYEFEGVMKAADLKVILDACDADSEFPEGSGWSYTRFLWPQAFEHGFRLADQSKQLWDAFKAASQNTHLTMGLSMNWVARALAEFAQANRNRDLPVFAPTPEMWSLALKAMGYRDAPRLRKRPPKPPSC
jgi:hypothetical protein